MGFEGFSRHVPPQEKEPVEVIPELEATLEGLRAQESAIESEAMNKTELADEVGMSGLNSVQERELGDLISRLTEEKE